MKVEKLIQGLSGELSIYSEIGKQSVVSVVNELFYRDSVRHTCVAGTKQPDVPDYTNPCLACVEESRQEKKDGRIANPVCSKCGKQMVEPMPGEPYLCNNSNCPGCLPDNPTGKPNYLSEKSGLTEGELGFFNSYAEHEYRGQASAAMVDALNIIRRLSKSNQELKAINFKYHVEHDGGPAGRTNSGRHEIRFNDPQRLLNTLNNFRADLAKCYGMMGGPALKPTLEQCMKDTDILLELVRVGKESLEAQERYKDRLARMVGRLWYKTASGTNVITHAVGLLNSIDKHCDERNK